MAERCGQPCRKIASSLWLTRGAALNYVRQEHRNSFTFRIEHDETLASDLCAVCNHELGDHPGAFESNEVGFDTHADLDASPCGMKFARASTIIFIMACAELARLKREHEQALSVWALFRLPLTVAFH
jgi:hypothetical protein